MKKTYMFIAAALVVMAACNKVDTPATKSLSFNATVEQHEDVTKTYLDGTSVKWTANDEIAVFDNATTPKKAELKTTLGDVTSASFNVEVSKDDGFDDANASWAIYPYSATSSATTAGVITFTVDGTQNYVENSFDPEHNVMVGKVQDGNIAFKNAFGLLKLQLKGVMTVGKIELTSKTDQKLYGTFTANAESGYTAVYSTGGGNTITLNCVKPSGDGIVLDAVNATNFYFVVPQGAFPAGFSAVVYDVDGYTNNDLQITVETSTANTIARTKVKAMPAVGMTLVPIASFTPKYYVSSDDKNDDSYVPAGDRIKQYINTGFCPTGNSRVIADAKYNAVGAGSSKLLGSREDFTDKNFIITASGGSHSTIEGAYATNGIVGNGTLDANTDRHLFELNQGVTTVDGMISLSRPKADFTSTYPIYLFNANYANVTGGGSYSQFYFVKLYNDGVLIKYLIPVQEVGGENRVGLYDRMSGGFIPSSCDTTPYTPLTAAGDVLDVTFHK